MSGYEFEDLPLTAFGDLRTAELTPQFQGSFEYTVDNTELSTNVVAAGGTVTQASAMAVCATSTTTASTAQLQSERHARYRAGLGALLRFTALFTTPVAATEQLIGILDEPGSSQSYKNGYAIGYIGTTFGFHRFSNDTITTVAQANWDDPLDGTGESGMTLDQTKLSPWAIRVQYLGAGAIQLLVEDQATGKLMVVHTIDYSNQNTEPSTFNPNYHFTMWVDNKATTSNLILKSASYGYFIEGKTGISEAQQPQFSSGLISLGSVTTEVAIFTVRCKTTYASKTNFIEVLIERLVSTIAASGANNIGSVRIVKNATLGGSPSYADINTTDSVMEIDTAGTTLTGGKELVVEPLADRNDKDSEDLTPYTILMEAGDTITVSGTSSGTATFGAALLWKELF